MTVLTIVRHAQASFGSPDYDRLSPLGERQARYLGQWFRHIGYQPDKVITGGLRRHQQTANICLKAMDTPLVPTVTEAFREFNHREVIDRHAPGFREQYLQSEPRDATLFHTTFQAAVTRWTGGQHDADYSLNWPTFRQRVMDGLQALLADGCDHILLISSGGPIGVMAQTTTGAADHQAMKLCNRLYNTSVTKVRKGNLHGFNSVAHLEHQQDPALLTYI